jgi:hypothetical protein
MRTLPVLLCIFIASLSASPASAQYWLETQPGYKTTAPSSGQVLLLSSGDPLRTQISDCLGFTVDGVLRIESGMSRYLEYTRGANLAIREYALTSKPSGSVAPVKYAIEGQPIYLAFGTTDSAGYEDYVIATVSGDASGVSELDRFSLGAQYCAGIYALDLNADGVVELAIPYSTGAAGGGGVDVRAIVPTGGLAWFGNDELDGTLFSQSGYLNVLDYDNDGDWELEVRAPVLCSACGYMWSDLYTFDSDGWNWETDEARFAAYYKPQRDFYRALNDGVVKLAANPASMKYTGSAIESDYAVQIGGQWYTLDPFVVNGKPDRTWVSTLASLVSGW